MKGVRKDKARGGWTASYGSEYRKHFQTEQQAKNQREKWEKLFGKINMGHPKDWSNKISGNLRIVGSTGKTRNKSQVLLARNLVTNELVEVTAKDFARGGNKGLHHHPKVNSNNTTGYVGVKKNKDNKYFGVVVINKRAYVTSAFSEAKDAYQAKEKILNNFLVNGILPNPKKAKTNTGHKYISKIVREGREPRWEVKKMFKGKRYRKCFNNFTDALTYRNQWLTDHNLPIPD
jgi:hypothetical protein